MRIFSVDINFAEHWERSAIFFLCECLDLSFAFGLLVMKLIAGKCENLESTVLILFPQADELCIIRFGLTSATRNVDDQQQLPFELLHIHHASVDVFCRHSVELIVA